MTGLHVDLVASRDEFRISVAFDVARGEVLALLGPNGAGKSTVVEAIAGLAPIDAGVIRLGEIVLDDPANGTHVGARERRVGLVFQDRVLFPHLTAADNVGFGLAARGVGRAAARDRGTAMLRDLDLEHLAGRRAGDLSGGEAQQVAILRALAVEPEALVLDEPLSALDASSRVGVRRMLADHAATFPGPIVFITHDPSEAFILADHICVMEDGMITQRGPADDIRLAPRTRYIAELAGVNLVTGTARGGALDTGEHVLQVADTSLEGPVLATIEPRAIALHRSRPEGSARNTWETSIDRIEHHGDRVRLHTRGPLPLTVEVTPGSVAALGLGIGSTVWLAIKATEIGVQPA